MLNFKPYMLQSKNNGFLLLELMMAIVLFITLVGIIGAYINATADQVARAQRIMGLLCKAVNGTQNSDYGCDVERRSLPIPALPLEKRSFYTNIFTKRLRFEEVNLKSENATVSFINCYEE